MRVNELALRPAAEVDARLAAHLDVMQACVERGFAAEGILPGVLKVTRRAPRLVRELEADVARAGRDGMGQCLGARGQRGECRGRAGRHGADQWRRRHRARGAALLREALPGSDDAGIRRFLLTAGAIGLLYKRNASISGAEMGCQGEVGVACSMAAAGLAAALGGSNGQVENAAEIGMEHNLGLTCDPIAGLVQIPCIERNAMGAVKAINAARLALRGDGTHKVSLDQVIATMRQTGYDMKSIYKETSQGGLAVNVPEC